MCGDFERLLAHLALALTHPDQVRALADELGPAVARLDWAEMGPRYDQAMTETSRAKSSVKRE